MASKFKARKRDKNNIVHIYHEDGEVVDDFASMQGGFEIVPHRVALCGMAKEPVEWLKVAYNTDKSGVLDEDYLIHDGDIIGKICGNCSMAATSDKY